MNIKSYKKCLAVCGYVLCILFIFIFYFLIFPIKYRDIIVLNGKTNSIKPELISAIIKTESSFNRQAKSSVGAVGLMQIMPSTAKWICDKIDEDYEYNKLFEPAFNIKIGSFYFRYLLDKFEDKNVAICAYNAGEGVVNSWLKNKEFSVDNKTLSIVPYAETKNYLNKVLRYEKVYSLRIK